MNDGRSEVPVWYWIVSVLLLAWNLIGVLNFLQTAAMTESDIAALPDNQQPFFRSTLATILFGWSTITAVLGSVFLLLCKRVAGSLFILSLLGVIIHLANNLYISREIPEQQPMLVAVAMVLIVAGAFSIWFTRSASNRNWLQ